MKRMICLCLTLILTLSLVPAQVRAVINSVICYPGNTIDVVLSLAEDGDQPDGVMGRLSFDMDIFTLLPSKDVIGMDGINILNRQPVTISFRVNQFAPAGEYIIEARVIEAYDADGKEYTNARINPVQVTVMSAATATPVHTPAPTPTDKPLPLPSAAGMEKKQIKVGDYVTFGRYPQTAEGNDQTPIEWLVLDHDEENNCALIISRYGLDAKPYNTISSIDLDVIGIGFSAFPHAKIHTEVTWETSTIRAWLNKDFMNKAFSSTEQKAILTTAVDNSKSHCYSGYSTYGGKNTQDKIYLLSYAEANKYLGVMYNDSSRTKSRVAPTAYAISKGAYKNESKKTSEGKAAGSWWLRSPGHYLYNASIVNPDGSLNYYEVSYVNVVVRPAMWIDLDASDF